MGTAAWKQFLKAKISMLAAFDEAKEQASTHPVPTYHGIVAQAQFRQWLTDFLPAKYGVTHGYLVSQGLAAEGDTFRHFDIIVYDRLHAPVLWIEDHPDTTSGGASRGTPVEFTRAVIEVKASMTTASASEATSKLEELRPFLQSIDPPSEQYKRFLPEGFVSLLVFFELQKEHATSPTLLARTVPKPYMRGSFGGVILRGEHMPQAASGRIALAQSHQQLEGSVGPNGGSLLAGFALSQFELVAEGLFLGATLQWTEVEFPRFAFDLLAVLNATYQVGRLSSFHGLPFAGQPND